MFQILIELSLMLTPLFMFIVMISAIVVGVFYERKIQMLRNEEELQKITLLRERLEAKALSQQLGVDDNVLADI